MSSTTFTLLEQCPPGDSKSHNTIFSAVLSVSTHSECSTTPSQSPRLVPSQREMEADLRGIGSQAKPPPARTFNAPTSDANPPAKRHCRSESPAEDSPVKNAIQSPDEYSPFSDDWELYPMGDNEVPNATHRTTGTSTSPEILTVYERASSSDDSDGENADLDLSLEKTAELALSTWFGISLNRLMRPIRVIYAFEDTKNKCATILSDEGHYLHDSSQDDQSAACQEDETTPTSSDATASGSNLHSHGPCGSGINKRPLQKEGVDAEEDIDEASGAVTTIKKRGRNKKRRNSGDLSCPYRKRNPRTFNVRVHEECANKSFKTMTLLKKHLRAYHFKGSSLCVRRQEWFDSTALLLAHSQSCPCPPRRQEFPQQSNEEDGFDERIEQLLSSRRNDCKIDGWDTLYQVLFPNDKPVPDSGFEPVVENHDVIQKYQDYKGSEMVYSTQDVDDILRRFLPSLDEKSLKAITDSFNELSEKKFDRILAMSTGIAPGGPLTPQNSTDPGTVRFSLSGSDVVEVTSHPRNGNILDESFASEFLGNSGGTSTYLSPDRDSDDAVYFRRPMQTAGSGSYPQLGAEYGFQYVAMQDEYGDSSFIPDGTSGSSTLPALNTASPLGNTLGNLERNPPLCPVYNRPVLNPSNRVGPTEGIGGINFVEDASNVQASQGGTAPGYAIGLLNQSIMPTVERDFYGSPGVVLPYGLGDLAPPN